MQLVKTDSKDTYQILKTLDKIEDIPNGYYTFNFSDTGTYLRKTNDLINKEVKILHGEVSDKIFKDIDSWVLEEETYAKFNFPYKRGWFLYGDPGTGKTKIIESVLSKLNHLKVIVFNIEHPETLNSYINIINQFDFNNGILKDYFKVFIFEDMEALIESKYDEARLLQILDGNIKIHKCLFFATTNHPDNIPERLLSRPSRFDRKIKIDKPSEDLILQYLKSFDIKNIEKILPYVTNYTFAQIKEFIISYYVLKLNVEDIQSELKKYKEEAQIGFDKGRNFLEPKLNQPISELFS